MNDVTSSLIFNGYIIENINFKFNLSFNKAIANIDMKLDLDLSSGIKCDFENSKGNVILTAHIFKNAPERNLPFELEVTIIGEFGNKGANPDEFNKRLELNGVTILFPFLRSTIADVTRIANTSVLMLPTINVHNLIKDKEQNEVKK